jgi:ABC-type uncharacterized transport system ATPase subunit
LYGKVDEIKRRFAGNAVIIEGQGDFSQIPGVLQVREQNGGWHLALAPTASPQDVFRSLAGRPDVKIDRFEIAEASLDDIFIMVVKGEVEREVESGEWSPRVRGGESEGGGRGVGSGEREAKEVDGA